MFLKNTVFVLGAGASKPYGYPLGKQLTNEIIKIIDSESIYLPMSLSDDTNQLKDYKHQDSWNFSSLVDLQNNPDGPPHYVNIRTGENFFLKKFSDIKIFNELKDKLVTYDPVSIDLFLSKHPDIADAGRIMIAYAILSCEDLKRFENFESNKDNWYPYIWNDLMSGCKEPENIIDNKISFITFNYDCSLDYFLESRVKKGDFVRNLSDKNKENLDKVLNVHHVYGKIHSGTILNDYGLFYLSGNDAGEFAERTKFNRFLYSVNNHSKIKLIGERDGENQQILKLIKDAEEIVIIGFGFDRTNLDFLGFQGTQKNLKKFLKNKTIKYLDYAGKMNSLAENFESIKNETAKIIRSKSKSICDAYTNDFKLSLY